MATTKSNAPWSVKGIERDARETAKDAARREGKTVGEWLNQTIYTAGTENGGGNLDNIVTAIEMLNERVGRADADSARAIEDLSRNMGKIVERVQRLERVKAPEGSNEALATRLERLEKSGGNKERADALRALEKAVGQIAIQFESTHKKSLARIDENEQKLQNLAERLEASGESDASAVGYLKDAVDGLSARITRAERISAEAVKLKNEAAGSVDPQFVERTGARLRVLGEEIKRGGDQISALDNTINKLAGQIEAAEQRSSKGVQTVAETISGLRKRFEKADDTDVAVKRSEIEAVVADANRHTEERIADLQTSFDRMIARIENAEEVTQARIEPDQADSSETDDFDAPAAFDQTDPLEEIGPVVDNADDDFDFGLDDIAAPIADASAQRAPVEETTVPDPIDELDEILADLDNLTAPETAATEPQTLTSPTPAVDADEETGPEAILDASLDDIEPVDAPPLASEEPTSEKEDYLKAARRAAKEAAARAAEEKANKGAKRRRKLTPKQKAILAARARRKKAAEAEAAAQAEAETQRAEFTSETDASEAIVGDILAENDRDEDDRKGPLAGLTSGFSSLLSRRKKKELNEEDDNAADEADTSSIETSESDQDSDEGSGLLAKIKAAAAARPISLVLCIGILLALAAFVVMLQDLLKAQPEQTARPAVIATEPVVVAEEAAPAVTLREENAPQVPAAPALDPRTLYADAMTALNAAENTESAAAAIEKLSEAAALGHPPAQLQLGELYKLGQGVDQDLEQARTWFRRSANGGNVLAMHRIGVMTARGDGGPANASDAIGWFELAANRGLVDSQYNLGAIYHPGADGASGVQEAGRAYYWYTLAANNGDDQAQSLAAGVATFITDSQRRALDEEIAAWTAETSDPAANELTPGN